MMELVFCLDIILYFVGIEPNYHHLLNKEIIRPNSLANWLANIILP